MTIVIIIGVILAICLIATARIFKNMHSGEVAKEATKRKEARLNFRKWRIDHRGWRRKKPEVESVPTEVISE